MTEGKHPYWARADALVEDPRFCEYLDATASHASRWPHNRTTARRWLCQACGVESLGRLSTCAAGAQALREIEQAYALWDRNQELPV